MSHLNPETIARLVEDAPDGAEAAHLAACEECRTQLEAMTEDVHALAMLPDMATAPDQWEALEQRLTAEGLIRTPVRGYASRTLRMGQIAAAIMIFAGGTLAGRMIAAPASQLAATDAQQTPAETRVPEQQTPAQSFNLEPQLTAAPAGETAPSADAGAAPRPVTLAANTGARRTPATVEQAAQQLRETEAYYLDALTRFAELATQSGAGDPVARLAALQSIILTTQAALNEAPTDPVINGYHLTALAQRDATARQVAAASSERYY